MAVSHGSLPIIQKAIREVCFALEKKGYQIPSWTKLNEDTLWRELAACILGSRVRFEIAHSAVERMEKMRLFDNSRRSSCFDNYEQDIMRVLSGELCLENVPTVKSCYPFFRIRATQIRRAAERMYGKGGSIREFLEDACNVLDARRRLAFEVPGLGPKQASLFLRNIGYNPNVAVLDVHVLTYMRWTGLIDSPLRSVSAVRKYEKLENSFIQHSCSLGYAPDRFDLAVWIVMRVAKQEYKIWE